MLTGYAKRWRSLETFYNDDSDYRERSDWIQSERSKVKRENSSECDTYNSFTSHKICKAMYARFPRELRDMVYGYITSDKVAVCTELEQGTTDEPGPSSRSSSLRFIAERWHSPSPCALDEIKFCYVVMGLEDYCVE